MTNQELRDRVRKEIIEEGKAIERRIEADGSLKDLKMPDDSFKDLMRRAEAQKQTKHRRGHVRKRLLLAVAVAAVLLVGGTLSATGARLFTPKVENRDEGDGLDITITNDNENFYVDVTEDEAYDEIEERLGIQALRLGYKPEGMELEKIHIGEDMGEALMEFYYGDKILTVYGNKQYDHAGTNVQIDGEKVDTVNGFFYNEDVEIWKVDKGDGDIFYRSELTYGNAYYYISGAIELEEFKNILSEIYFENV